MKVFWLLLLIPFKNFAQSGNTDLFKDATPIDVKIIFSKTQIREIKRDTSYRYHTLYYQSSNNNFDSVRIKIRRRGNFRLKQCYYPQLKIKFPDKIHKGTPFEGNSTLKLVLPCNNRSGNDLIIKEYLCYKMYQQITPLSFPARLVNLRFTEVNGKKTKDILLKGILVEDVRKLCKRISATYLPQAKVPSHVLNDTAAARLFLFEYMISNTDWSTYYQHNMKTVKKQHNYYSLPYDFDMSGVVDANYAVVSVINGEKLNPETVRDRVYRGFCISTPVMNYVRNEFLADKNLVTKMISDLRSELSASDIEGIKEYVDEFFEIISKDNRFNSMIVSNCRQQ